MYMHSLYVCIFIDLHGVSFILVLITSSAFPHFTSHHTDHRFVGSLEKVHYLSHHCTFPNGT